MSKLNDSANFIKSIQEEQSVPALKRLLPRFYSEFGGVILQRIAELLPQEDFKLYLSLALWNHFNGYNREAFEFLEKAQLIAPDDHETLRCDLWLRVTNGEDAKELCETLLRFYPDDVWAQEICQLVQDAKHPNSLEGPRWNNPWEDLVNDERAA